MKLLRDSQEMKMEHENSNSLTFHGSSTEGCFDLFSKPSHSTMLTPGECTCMVNFQSF